MKEGWKCTCFEDCLQKVKHTNKLKSNLYKEEGKYPIVSQEKEIISGYWDDDNDLYHHDKPIVIFGDHTKVIKYIDFDFVLGADGTKILYPKENLNSKFFYYWLCSVRLRDLGYARHYRLLKEQIVPVPPLSVQERIVMILDAAFAKIDALKQNAQKGLQAVKDLWQATLKEELKPKEGWTEYDLQFLCSKIGSGATPSGGQKSYITEGVSLIRSLNVWYNRFEYKDLAHISDKQANALNNVTIKEDDVLFNITGASIARCCVVPKNVLPARVNQHVSILRAKKDYILPSFLCYAMISPFYQKPLLETGEAGATRQALTKAQLENFRISIPSLNEQNNVIKKLELIAEKCSRIQSKFTRELTEYDALKQSILRKAFSGELQKHRKNG